MEHRKYCKHCLNALRNHILPNVNSPKSYYFYLQKEKSSEAPTKDVPVTKRISSQELCPCPSVREAAGVKRNSSDSKLRSSRTKLESTSQSSTYKRQLEKCEAEAQHLKELEKELDLIRNQVVTLTKNKALVMSYTNELQQRHNMLMKKSEEQGREIEQLKNENKRIVQQIFANKRDNDTSKNRISTISEVQKNLDICEERLTKLYNQFKDGSALKEICHCGKRISKELQDKSLMTTSDLRYDAKDAEINNKIEELIQNYQTAKENQAKCEAENEQLTRNIEELQSQLKKALSETQYHQRNLGEKEDLCGQIAVDYANLQRELQDNCEEIKKLRKTAEDLQKEVDDRTREVKDSESRYQTLLAQYQTLEMKYKMAEENSKENFRQLELMRDNEIKLKEELKRMHEELDKLTNGTKPSVAEVKDKGVCTCINEMANACKCVPMSKDPRYLASGVVAPCEGCDLKTKLLSTIPPAPPLQMPPPQRPYPPPMPPPHRPPPYPPQQPYPPMGQPPGRPSNYRASMMQQTQTRPNPYGPPPPRPYPSRPQSQQLRPATFQSTCDPACPEKQALEQRRMSQTQTRTATCSGVCGQQVTEDQSRQSTAGSMIKAASVTEQASRKGTAVSIATTEQASRKGTAASVAATEQASRKTTAASVATAGAQAASQEQLKDASRQNTASSLTKRTDSANKSQLSNREMTSVSADDVEPEPSLRSGSFGEKTVAPTGKSDEAVKDRVSLTASAKSKSNVGFKEETAQKQCKQYCPLSPCKVTCPPPKRESKTKMSQQEQAKKKSINDNDSLSECSSDDSSTEEFELECTCEVEEN